MCVKEHLSKIKDLEKEIEHLKSVSTTTLANICSQLTTQSTSSAVETGDDVKGKFRQILRKYFSTKKKEELTVLKYKVRAAYHSQAPKVSSFVSTIHRFH